MTDLIAPQVGLEPTTTRLTAECSAIELLRIMESGSDLSSRAVSSQVLSALESLTSVFGMGTGGTSPSLPPEIVAIELLRLSLSCFHSTYLRLKEKGRSRNGVNPPCTLTTAHRMILQTVPISSQFSVSDLLSLACFACAPLAILIFSFQALNEAFDRLVSSSYTPYGASTDDLSTW